MIVYVLVPEAVYDHGIVGVYGTEEDARDAAERLWPETDGHHSFRIVPRVVGETHKDVFRLAYNWRGVTPDPGEPRIRVGNY
jgi:hypothetical protein